MSPWNREFLDRGFRYEETHISEVYLGPRDAWKIKKPVNFGFLDYTSPEKRKAACEAEVELNRRFAPSVYLGVVPLVRQASGRYAFGGEGRIADWAVHMRRLPEADRADRRLAEGRLTVGALKALAARLAAFHAGNTADADAAVFGSPAAVALNQEENFIQTRPFLSGLIGAEAASGLEARMTARIRTCAPAIAARYRGDRVCDGHGDLRLNQIYVDDAERSEILDCIEFNDRFRYADPACDIAFASMDLAFRGRPDLAETFLAAYAYVSGDYDLYSVIDFYQAYRACVRGKVEGFLAGEMDPGPRRDSKEEEARAYFRFAAGGWDHPAPMVIAIGGGMGTGKTSIAAGLADRLGIPVVSTDPLRKRMAGLAPDEKRPEALWQGLYSAEATEKAYAEATRITQVIGESGRSVIVDASFRSRAARKMVRDAAVRAGRRFLFIECRVDPEISRERLRRRASVPNPSDGDERNFRSFLAAWEPAEDIPAAERLILETAAPIGECVEEAMRACARMRERSAPAEPS